MQLKIALKLFAYLLPLLLIAFDVSSQTKNDSSVNKSHLIALPVISRSIETDWSFGAGGTYTFYTTRKKDSTTRTSSIRFLGFLFDPLHCPCPHDE